MARKPAHPRTVLNLERQTNTWVKRGEPAGQQVRRPGWKGKPEGAPLVPAKPRAVSRQQARKNLAKLLQSDPIWPEPSPRTSTNPKDAIGSTKSGLSAIPASALFHLGLAMTEGETKYGLLNWRKSAVQADIYFDAMMRHAWLWKEGQRHAGDGLKGHHLGYAMACCAILLDGEETGMLIDNRGKGGNLPELLAKLQDQLITELPGLVAQVKAKLESDK